VRSIHGAVLDPQRGVVSDALRIENGDPLRFLGGVNSNGA